jgi:FKBP-type peptidyl-prolyl cis-trans isomerase SlyD
MKIEKNSVVTLRYHIKDLDDVPIDEGDALTYLHGGYGIIFPQVEAVLADKGVGDAFTVTVEPEDAFGLYQVDLMKIEPRHLFPEELAEGMMFEGVAEGREGAIVYRVTDVGEEQVIVDGNHPLAGVTLVFSGEVMAIRAATESEIAHQHVHNGDCH